MSIFSLLAAILMDTTYYLNVQTHTLMFRLVGVGLKKTLYEPITYSTDPASN